MQQGAKKKKMNKKLIILLTMITTLLSGCWDSKESERMLYLYGLGVDFEDDQYKMYAQIIDFTNIAKSEQPSNPDAIQSEVGYATGRTISEAIYKLYNSVDEQLFWGHFSYFIFSQEVLKEGRINPIINTYMRFIDTRYQTWIYSTEDSVKDLMLSTPIINKAISLSKMSDPINSYKQSSFIEPLNIRNLLIGMDEPGHEVKIPLVRIVNNWETDKGKDPISSIDGITVISPKENLGVISGNKANGLQWMTNKTIRSGISIKRNTGEEQLISVILQNNKVTVKPIVKNDKVLFDIHVRNGATVSGFEGDVTEKEVRRLTEKKIKKQIKETYQEGLNINADVYRLSEHLYRQDVKAWKRMQKDGKIELDENSIRKIHVDLEKINSGRKTFDETIKK